MWNKKKKIKSGWQKTEKTSRFNFFKKIHFRLKSNRLVHKVIIKPKRISIREKVIKFLIFIALRLSIRPSLWKDNRKNYQIIDRTYQKIISSDFLFIPPAFAFYLIMSFLPIILLVLLIISQVPFVYQFAIKLLHGFLSGGETSFTQFINNLKSPGAITLLVAMILLSFWLASAGFSKFIYTESYSYDYNKIGGYWMNKLRGSMIVIFITIYIAIAIILLSLTPKLLISLGVTKGSIGFQILYIILLSFLSFLASYLAFAFLFKFSPRFYLSWKQIHPGALATAIPVTLFLVLFTQLNKIIFKYKNYGTLSVFMIIAASMFQISYFIYVGLIVNVVFYKVHFGEKMYSKKLIIKRKIKKNLLK